MSDNAGFRRTVKAFESGQVDVIMMHIDTVKLLDLDEWELLKAAGANVVVVHKKDPDAGAG